MTLTAFIVALIMLLLGFLLGWFIEWRIDLAYWRSYFEEAGVGEAKALDLVRVLPAAAAAAAQLPPGSQDVLVHALREQIAQRDADLTALRAMIEQLSANEAHRREQEAELMEEARRLREHLDELTAAKTDADAEWRHELARREQQWQESREAELAALRAENQELRDKLSALKSEVEAEWRDELARREGQWREAKDDELVWLRTQNQELQTKLESVDEKFARYQANHPAELSVIKGIGPKIESELRRAGINNYAELASRTPQDLHVLLNPPEWRKLDFESWIAQAKVLAKNEGA